MYGYNGYELAAIIFAILAGIALISWADRY